MPRLKACSLVSKIIGYGRPSETSKDLQRSDPNDRYIFTSDVCWVVLCYLSAVTRCRTWSSLFDSVISRRGISCAHFSGSRRLIGRADAWSVD